MTKQKLSAHEREAFQLYGKTPSQVSSNFVRFAQEIIETPGVEMGGTIGKYVIPIRPGRTLGLLARPGHGKTTYGGALVYREATRIVRALMQDKLYAAHVSWEQSVEELDFMYQNLDGYGVSDIAWGRVPIEKIVENSISRPELPVWIFGDSLYSEKLDIPPLTIDRLFHTFGAIDKVYGKRPSIVFIDYIQDVPVPDERERSMQVVRAINMVKRLSITMHCPIVLGIQAKQVVDTRDNPIPEMGDAEWSNTISQKLDAMLSLVRPVRIPQWRDLDYLTFGGVKYPVEENLLIVQLNKQRMERGTGIWGIQFDPNTMDFKDYYIQPNGVAKARV